MTSSSSGHSSDDRWYEILENADYDTNLPKNTTTPPPLPARVNNSFQNLTSKRIENLTHSISQMQLNQNHQHNHAQQIVHNKIQVSHSLPLPHANFSLPLSSNSNYVDYEHIDQKVSLKQNDTRPLPRTANIEYLVTRTPKFDEKIAPEANYNDTTSLNDKNLLPSEDELSNGSGNVSPRLRRSSKQRGGQLTPSSGNSRNHSPRTIGETRLRPGVTPRSNRNSANLSSSTLQEDLMKLINPDYMEDNENYAEVRNRQENCNTDRVRSNENCITDRRGSNDNCFIDNRVQKDNGITDRNRSNENCNLESRVRGKENCINDRGRGNDNDNYGRTNENCFINRSRSNENCFIDSRNINESCFTDKRVRLNENCIIDNRSRSRENLNSLTLNSPQEVIFTMARPATVISNPSTASSPAPSENKLSKEERLSPRVNKNLTEGERDIDWPSLENVTREILRVSDSLEGISESQNKWEDDRLGMDASITST